MMEFRTFERRTGVAMRIDMDHPDRLRGPDGFQDRQADRMIAAHTQRLYTCLHHTAHEAFDICVAFGQAVAAAKRNITNVGGLDDTLRHRAMDMMIWPYSFHLTHGPRAEPGTGPIGNPEVHRYTDQGDIQPLEVAGITNR